MHLARLFTCFIAGFHYHLEGKRYVAGRDEDRVRTLLRELTLKSRQATRYDWLLACRAAIREIETLNTRAFLAYTISTSREPQLRKLAIWLRGRCGGYVGSSIVVKCLANADDATRKEVARALRRLSAWAALRNMASVDPNPRIRFIAQQPAAKAYSRRQSRFLENVAEQEIPTVKTPLMIAPGVDFSEPWPTKPLSVIRRILLRIASLATGI